MFLMAILLIPTAYAMLTANFLLAGGCVAGIILIRLLAFSQGDQHDEP